MIKTERAFANSDGEYEMDHILIEVWRGLAETIANVAQIDVKGRVASRKVIKDDRTFYNYAFVAEKIDFLSSKV